MVKKNYTDYKRQYACLEQLVAHESGWRINAHNRSSGAFGLFQFLPSTWGNYNFPYKPKDAYTQIRAGLRYGVQALPNTLQSLGVLEKASR